MDKKVIIKAVVIMVGIILVIEGIILLTKKPIYLMEDSGDLYVLGSQRTGKNQYRKSSVTQINFIDEKNAPNDYVISWDVSKDNDGTVTAWLTYEGQELGTSSSTYILYIGAEKEIKLSNAENLFKDYGYCKEIKGLERLDTSEVTSMNGMFSGCASLEKLDIDNLKIPKDATVEGMFDGCDSLPQSIKDKVEK